MKYIVAQKTKRIYRIRERLSNRKFVKIEKFIDSSHEIALKFLSVGIVCMQIIHDNTELLTCLDFAAYLFKRSPEMKTPIKMCR